MGFIKEIGKEGWEIFKLFNKENIHSGPNSCLILLNGGSAYKSFIESKENTQPDGMCIPDLPRVFQAVHGTI